MYKIKGAEFAHSYFELSFSDFSRFIWDIFRSISFIINFSSNIFLLRQWNLYYEYLFINAHGRLDYSHLKAAILYVCSTAKLTKRSSLNMLFVFILFCHHKITTICDFKKKYLHATCFDNNARYKWIRIAKHCFLEIEKLFLSKKNLLQKTHWYFWSKLITHKQTDFF